MEWTRETTRSVGRDLKPTLRRYRDKHPRAALVAVLQDAVCCRANPDRQTQRGARARVGHLLVGKP